MVAVKDHAARLAGEQVGVDGADAGPVGQDEEVQYRVADRLAEQIQVARDVGAGVVVEQAAVARAAQRAEPRVRPVPLRDLLSTDGKLRHIREKRVLRRLGREASHGGAVAEPARVERDRVVPLLQGGGDLRVDGIGERVELGYGPAGVDEERPDPVGRVGG
jgi:hypothetical protein